MESHCLRAPCQLHARARRASPVVACGAFVLLLALDTRALAAPQSDLGPGPDGALFVEGQDAPPARYEQAIDEAVDEHKRGHFEEAREHFREAHELFPNARTLRGLGKVEFELRNYGESVKFLEAALASEVRPLTQELRNEVETLLERARAYVGEVHVNVEPGTATVSVDGVTMATGPQVELDLLVGDHVLEFRASGHLPERRQVRVHGREHLRIRVVLNVPEDSARAGPTMPPDATRVEVEPRRRKWWLWTAVGVVAVGSAVAVALAVTRSRDEEGGGSSGLTLEVQ